MGYLIGVTQHHATIVRLSTKDIKRVLLILKKTDNIICTKFNLTKYYLNNNLSIRKVSKGAKIRNRCNQVPHLIQDTNGKVTNSQQDKSNKSQEVSPFPAGDHKAYITDAHKGIQTQDRKSIKDPQKKYRLGTASKIFYWRA